MINHMPDRHAILVTVLVAILIAAPCLAAGCAAKTGGLVSVTPEPGSRTAFIDRVVLEFSRDVQSSQLSLLVLPIGVLGVGSGLIDGPTVRFEFNVPDYFIPITVCASGAVTLIGGERVEVAETWSLEYAPAGSSDFPLPPAPTVTSESSGEYVFSRLAAPLYSTPGPSGGPEGTLPAGTILRVADRCPGYVKIMLEPPADAPAFRDRQGKLCEGYEPETLAGWVDDAAVVAVSTPTWADVSYVGYRPWKSLAVLHKGCLMGLCTVSGDLTPGIAGLIDDLTRTRMLSLYFRPIYNAWGSTLSLADVECFSRAIDAYTDAALAVMPARLDASGLTASAAVLIDTAGRVNMAQVRLLCPLLRQAALEELSSQLAIVSGRPVRISSGADADGMTGSLFTDAWQALERQLLTKLSPVLQPTEIPD